MAFQIIKVPLSGSSHGRPIKVTQTSIGSGDVIHTAQALTLDGKGDEVVLYAYSSHSAAVTLTLGLGGTTSPDDLITEELEPGRNVLVLPGFFYRNALVLRAAASVANVVAVHGYALRSS